ncbi:hypothetical protein EDI_025170 [Entamoeba dispar SAW760]|uniref:Uncharacterized protein n=1 Tax=Entamoeba dispar (strain ATCC PRA-260 / SAW760) TaxID=370354 RepID=B0ERB8_ENTDS|nr:uncharacterized protein EDI_025170 [Entamoeba dispar SAW760]EDR22936.1 hypothetical protein EDI_025170 [Entamoeba dispar SAW760]|eukprot:EDR22936.1 hypothetical protein EDI_025170 [Entamoeba dispar SAW760]
MEIDPHVFESEFLLKSDNVPSQYRKDKLIQTIKYTNSQYFKEEGRFIIAVIRKERINNNKIQYKLYMYLYEQYSPSYKIQEVIIDNQINNYKKVFIQFTEHGEEVVILSGDYYYFFIPIEWNWKTKLYEKKSATYFLEKTNQQKSRIGLSKSKSELILNILPSINKPIKVGNSILFKHQTLPKTIVSFVIWTTRNAGIGIIVSIEGIIIFFDLITSSILKILNFKGKIAIKEALLCTEDSNVNKISTFLVLVFEMDKEMTSVCCQQLEIKSLRSSECINIFTKDIDPSLLSLFIIKDKGTVQLHYFNNKTCLGFFHKMSLSLYSFYNQRLFFFDVCQSFPRSSICFLNNKYLFQFSRLTDEVHCCGVIPLMNLYDKTPPTQLINFGIDSNYFNIHGVFPFFTNFRVKDSVGINKSTEYNYDGCILWNKYCIAIIHQIHPKEAIFCHKFLNAQTIEQETSVIQLFTITQSVDILIQNVSKYYIEKGMIQKAQQLCKLNHAISLPLVKLNLSNLDFKLNEFDELINDCYYFIKNKNTTINNIKYIHVLLLIELAKVIKFYIADDKHFLSTISNCNSNEASFILMYLVKTQSSQFQNYILAILIKYPQFIRQYIDWVIKIGFNFISFEKLFISCPIEYITCALSSRIILNELPIELILKLFFYCFNHSPSIYALQVISEKLFKFTNSELDQLINFLTDKNPLFHSSFPIFYDLAFCKLRRTLYAKALLIKYSNSLKTEHKLDNIDDCSNFIQKVQRWDEVYFDELIELTIRMKLYITTSFLFAYSGKFEQSIDCIIIVLKESSNQSIIVKNLLLMLKDAILNFNLETQSIKQSLESKFNQSNINTDIIQCLFND